MTQRAIKRIALITMIIDHIGSHIPGMPIWFRYVGRISAPLFVFCSVWGFCYTEKKEKYLVRLYILSACMSIGNCAMGGITNGNIPENNFFMTLFLGALIVYIFERWKVKGISLFCVYQVCVVFLLAYSEAFARLINNEIHIPYWAEYIAGTLSGCILSAEGGILFVALYVIMYFVKSNILLMSGMYIMFSFVMYKGTNRVWNSAFFKFTVFGLWEFEYLMILALPITLLYNGKRGRGSKYFYYWFYPVHIWALLLVECFLGMKAR